MANKNYVYMLECVDGTYYTGWTVDLAKRLREHNEGTSLKAAKYTRGRRPVKLIYWEECADKSQALKREWAIKKMTRAKKEKLAGINLKPEFGKEV
ncbi:GIY-YIG nuclease family protein [Aminipila butyrica]|uniref:GIY-YIG nuclease family protein n=1 Tax=Aminipila butyrica TaxID=433296 RepID=A0A858BRS3_9FIRM|nr:GIY-YIG nuclease family protein [Aminipila butyrica]QIB67889.1 GIY-YIG nuclease family protein [Aminipila butyrica]